MQNDTPRERALDARRPLPTTIRLPLELRLHGRGGQGGVTCAKLIASLFTEMGLHVQAFGDYGSERAGAPIQAFCRADRAPIVNRNKVYRPGHLIVLDEGLLGPSILAGVDPGTLLLINTSAPLSSYADYAALRVGVVDATAIAREHGIGSTSVVIINTTILGAYARMLDIDLGELDTVFESLGLEGDLAAAEHAYAAVHWREPDLTATTAVEAVRTTPPDVLPVPSPAQDIAASLKTGTWSNLAPRYREQPAPCNGACPAGNDVVGFIQTLKSDGLEAASRLLLQTQPLPSVCGRVCPAPCMTHCNRIAFDGAVNIRGLERWIGDHVDWQPTAAQAPTPRVVAIVGGGPAGLSAAWQLALAGHTVELHEAGPALGGVLRDGIPAFRLPDDVLEREIARIEAVGVRVHLQSRVDALALEELRARCDAVIVCAGFGAPMALDAAGAELPGVDQGLRFLARAKSGNERLGGHVLVVGGGNTAIDCVRTALRCGAASVRLVYRRRRDDMPAIPEEIEEAEREGMRLMLQRQPVAFAGNGRITTAVLAEVEPGLADASGRRRPVVTGRTESVPCDHVLLALGQATDVPWLPAGWAKQGDRAWYDEAPLNVWFAGDCGTADGTVTHAIGNGRRIAAAALAALDGANAERAAEPATEPAPPVPPGQIRFEHYGVAPAHRDRHRPPAEGVGGFAETNLGLAGPDEADRCFSCGHCTRCDTCLVYCPDGVIFRDGAGYRIDEAFCKGCGMCVAECPRGAMEMHEKHHAGAPA